MDVSSMLKRRMPRWLHILGALNLAMRRLEDLTGERRAALRHDPARADAAASRPAVNAEI